MPEPTPAELRAQARADADQDRPPLERARRMLEQSRNAFNETLEYLAVQIEAPEREDGDTAAMALISNVAASVYGPIAAIANLMLHDADERAKARQAAAPGLEDLREPLAMKVWHATQEAGATTTVGDAAAAAVREALS